MNKNTILFIGGAALGSIIFYFSKNKYATKTNFVGGTQFFKSERQPNYTI